MACDPQVCDDLYQCLLTFEPKMGEDILSALSSSGKNEVITAGKETFEVMVDNSHWHIQLFATDTNAVKVDCGSRISGYREEEEDYLLQNRGRVIYIDRIEGPVLGTLNTIPFQAPSIFSATTTTTTKYPPLSDNPPLYDMNNDSQEMIEDGFGYVDLKYVLQGGSDAGPLSFDLTTTREEPSYIFICQPPGLWGKLPEGCGHILEYLQVMVSMYTT